jgi:alpha-1,3-glucan synthase
MTRPSFFSTLLFTLFTTTTLVFGLPYDAAEADWNLNVNRTATNPLDYHHAERPDGFTYATSPPNWRIPFYTVFLDRFVNGDPTNDDINGTVYETDMLSTQLRFGGDLAGLVDSLDYIAGMGIKVHSSSGLSTKMSICANDGTQAIYIAGSPFINPPWGADSYSVSRETDHRPAGIWC